VSETREKKVRELLLSYKSGDHSNPYEMAQMLRDAFDAGRLSGAEEERAAVVEALREVRDWDDRTSNGLPIPVRYAVELALTEKKR